MPRACRADAVLLLAAGSLAGAPLALAPLPTAAALVVAGAMLVRCARGWVVALALTLAAVGAVRSGLGMAAAGAAQRRTVAWLAGRPRCHLQAQVVRSPVMRTARWRTDERSSQRGGAASGSAVVELRAGACADRALTGQVRVRIYGVPASLARGDSLQVEAELAPVRLFDNPELTDPRVRLALTGVSASGGVLRLVRTARGESMASYIDRARAQVRARIEATFAPAVAPYARALVLGENGLPESERESFRISGLAHLLAVSGTHLVIAVLALGAGLRALLLRLPWLAARFDVGRISAALSVPLAWAYADFAGGGGSAYRAAAMLTAAMVARAAGRQPSGVRVLGVSLLASALVEPLALSELSFALSAAATAGLLVGRQRFGPLVRASPALLRPLVSSMTLTASAMLACAPVLLTIGPRLPLLGVAANVLAAPVGELVALPLCLLHALLSWAPAAERGAAVVAGGALQVVRAVAEATAASPAASLWLVTPTAWQLAVLAAGAVVVWRSARRRWAIGGVVATLLALELFAVLAGAPQGRLRITALDVGQGDALLVDLPDGELMLIDGGGLVGSPLDVARRVVLPVLRARRRRRIDIAVLTHPHPDHYLGLLATLRQLEVGEVWSSGLDLEQRPHGEVAAAWRRLAAAGVRVVGAAALCGRAIARGGAELRVLWPCPRYDLGRNTNDNSVVLRLQLGRRVALLVGDAEHEAEEVMLQRSTQWLDADFLKVGHHGSRTSTTRPFLAAVSPQTAAISCGVRNRFGHPSPPVVRRLLAAGIALRRTDRNGAIVWETDGSRARFGAVR